MSKFAVHVDAAVSDLGGGAGAGLDENDFIKALRLVFDAVREIRRAVLMNMDEEELDPEDVELDEHYTLETRSKCLKYDAGARRNNRAPYTHSPSSRALQRACQSIQPMPHPHY